MINLMGAVLEVGICFLLLYFVLLEKEYIEKWKWIIVGGVAMIMGKILADSWTFTYVSVGVLSILILFSSFISWLLIKRAFMTILSVTWTYYVVISIMQIFMIFWGIEYSRADAILGGISSDPQYINIVTTARQITFVFSGLIAFVVVLQIRRLVKKNEIHIYEHRNMLLVFDFVFSLIFLCYERVFHNMTINISKVEVTKMLSFVALSILVSAIMIVLLKNKMIEKQNEILQFQEELSKRRYEELAEIISKNHQLVHDMNNHLFMLQEYAREEDIKGLQRYIQEVQQEYLPSSRKTWTGNQALDFILNQKRAEAKQQKIEFQIQADKSIYLPMTDSEICVLFGNLLDNAIEASAQIKEEKKWIKVSIGQQKEMFFLNIINNYTKAPVMQRGEYITTKQQKDAHGYGIKTVKRIVEKYEGILNLHNADGKFEVRMSFFSNSQIEEKETLEGDKFPTDKTRYFSENDNIFKVAFADLVISVFLVIYLFDGYNTNNIFSNTGFIIIGVLLCGILGEVFVLISRYRGKLDGITYAIPIFSIVYKFMILLAFVIVQLMAL